RRRRGRRLSAMELQLRELPPRLGRRDAGADPGVARRHRRRPKLVPAQRVARPARADPGQSAAPAAPCRPRQPIAGAVLTNGDVDAIAGLLTLRESQKLAVYATPRVLDVLAANSIFNVLNPDYVARRPIALDQPADLQTRDGAPAGLRVEAFSVPGKVALYLEDASIEQRLAQRSEDTIGLEISAPATGKRFYYLPACAALDDELK